MEQRPKNHLGNIFDNMHNVVNMLQEATEAQMIKCNNKYTEKVNEVSLLQTKLDEKEKTITQMQHDKDTAIEQLKSDSRSKEAKIQNELKHSIYSNKVLQSEVDRLTKEIKSSANQEKMDQMQKRIEEHCEDFANLNEKYHLEKRRHQEVSKLLAAKNTELNTIKEDKKKTDKKIQDILASKDVLEGTLKKTQDEVLNLQSKLEAQTTKAVRMEADRAEYQRQYETASDELKRLRSDNARLHRMNHELTATGQKLSEENSALGKRMREDAWGINGAIQGASARIMSAEGRAMAAEGEIRILRARLAFYEPQGGWVPHLLPPVLPPVHPTDTRITVLQDQEKN